MKTLPLHKWVNYARGTRGVREFAQDTNLGIGHISQLETGKSTNPEFQTLVAIARASQGRCLVPELRIK